MPSERDGWHRLHPYTLLFALGRHAYASRAVLFPGLIALVWSQRQAGGGWQAYQAWFLAPVPLLLVYELFQYLTLGYRFAEHDIVVARGLLWKQERHIPYARVQNIELVQHWGHRLAGVATVRLDTGTGADADAELSVLSLDAVDALRQAVREGRRAALPADAAEPVAPPQTVLSALGLRDLALHGLLTSRGIVVILALAGALWQADMDGWPVARYLPSIKGLWRGVVTATPRLIAELALLGLIVVLVFRLLSAAWSVIKLFDFSLTVRGAELFQSYGLITRVGRTIPRGRIQKLTITDTPLMRWLERATVTVDTAAFVRKKEEQALEGSQVLVPLVPWPRLAPLLREVHPAGATADLAALTDLDALDWHPVDGRAFRRLARGRTAFAVVAGAGLWFAIGWWAWLAAVAVAAWLLLLAWIETRFTSFAWAGETLCFRSSNGWTRRISLVRSGRVQVVTMLQSPLDRRWAMKRVTVDTAGAAGQGHKVEVPWLAAEVADALYARLRHAAAGG